MDDMIDNLHAEIGDLDRALRLMRGLYDRMTSGGDDDQDAQEARRGAEEDLAPAICYVDRVRSSLVARIIAASVTDVADPGGASSGDPAMSSAAGGDDAAEFTSLVSSLDGAAHPESARELISASAAYARSPWPDDMLDLERAAAEFSRLSPGLVVSPDFLARFGPYTKPGSGMALLREAARRHHVAGNSTTIHDLMRAAVVASGVSLGTPATSSAAGCVEASAIAPDGSHAASVVALLEAAVSCATLTNADQHVDFARLRQAASDFSRLSPAFFVPSDYLAKFGLDRSTAVNLARLRHAARDHFLNRSQETIRNLMCAAVVAFRSGAAHEAPLERAAIEFAWDDRLSPSPGIRRELRVAAVEFAFGSDLGETGVADIDLGIPSNVAVDDRALAMAAFGFERALREGDGGLHDLRREALGFAFGLRDQFLARESAHLGCDPDRVSDLLSVAVRFALVPHDEVTLEILSALDLAAVAFERASPDYRAATPFDQGGGKLYVAARSYEARRWSPSALTRLLDQAVLFARGSRRPGSPTDGPAVAGAGGVRL